MLIPTGDKSNLNTFEPGCCFSLLVVLHGFDVRCPSRESNLRPPPYPHPLILKWVPLARLHSVFSNDYGRLLRANQTAISAERILEQGDRPYCQSWTCGHSESAHHHGWRKFMWSEVVGLVQKLT